MTQGIDNDFEIVKPKKKKHMIDFTQEAKDLNPSHLNSKNIQLSAIELKPKKKKRSESDHNELKGDIQTTEILKINKKKRSEAESVLFNGLVPVSKIPKENIPQDDLNIIKVEPSEMDNINRNDTENLTKGSHEPPEKHHASSGSIEVNTSFSKKPKLEWRLEHKKMLIKVMKEVITNSVGDNNKNMWAMIAELFNRLDSGDESPAFFKRKYLLLLKKYEVLQFIYF